MNGGFVTWHDQKPSHPTKPDYLIEAESFQKRCEWEKDDYLTAHENDEWTEEMYIELGELAVLADRAYEDLLMAWRRWNDERGEALPFTDNQALYARIRN